MHYGTQNAWPLGALTFGFPGLWVPRLWVPWALASKVKEPKGGGTQRPGILGSLAFGFLRFWVSPPLGSFTFEASFFEGDETQDNSALEHPMRLKQ